MILLNEFINRFKKAVSTHKVRGSEQPYFFLEFRNDSDTGWHFRVKVVGFYPNEDQLHFIRPVVNHRSNPGPLPFKYLDSWELVEIAKFLSSGTGLQGLPILRIRNYHR